MVDGRTQSVLKNHFGTEIPFDVVAGGRGTLDGSSLSLRPFMCAIGELGLFFIHEGRVVLQVSWERIVQVSFNELLKNYDLEIQLDQINPLRSNLEFPWRNHFDLSISFNNTSHTSIFLERYYSFWASKGATEQSLELAKKWNKMGVRKPVIYSDYLKANESWSVSDEVKAKSYEIWGQGIDAEKLLYYVAGGICRGYLPSRIASQALDIFLESRMRNEEFTKVKFEISEDEREMVERLKELPDNSNSNLDSKPFTGWAFGKIEGNFDSELPIIPTPMRWTLFNLRLSDGLPIMKIWDYFFKGHEVVYLADKKDKTKFQGHLMGEPHKFEASGVHAATFLDFYTY
jgi:hypothetical protein